MEWSSFAFLIGNLAGAVLKRRPEFNNKFIPAAIFVVMFLTQFLAGAGHPVVPTASGSELQLAGFFDWKIVAEFIAALKQTAYAVLLHQLQKQFRRA